jgi:predicted ferric reductase
MQDVLSCGCNHYFTGEIDSGHCIMGLIMDRRIWKKGFLQMGVLFIGIPILLYALEEVPRRTLLKESLSLLTVLAFSVTIAQFFLIRGHRRMFPDSSTAGIVKVHKATAYFFIAVLLVHPFLIVLPRYFEAGITPKDALFTIITSFHSVGVITGVCAWVLILLIGITSFFRSQLFAKYTTWRIVHSILSVLFLMCGSWHAIDLGRHMNPLLSSYLVAGALSAVLLLVRTYIPDRKTKALHEVTI